MEDKSVLLQRLHQLEAQLDDIKLQLDPPKKSLFQLYVTRPCKTILANWTLIAFVIGLIIGLGVYWRYGISYFESQKNAWLTKQSAESYRKLGDRLMLYGEFDAARDAYNTALKMNSSNIDATRGMLITEVFKPLEGQKFIIPEVADLKLQYLKELVERDEEMGILGRLGLLRPKIEAEQGYIVDYFQGQLSQERDDYAGAVASFEASVTKNRKFVYGYISLAVIHYLQQDFDGALSLLKRAQEQDPKSAMVLNDMGACYFVKGDFSQAAKTLEASQSISPAFLTSINLAEAYRNLGEAQKAIALDEYAVRLAEDTQNEKERVLGGGIVSSFLPESRGAKPPPYYKNIYSLEEKRTLAYFSLSLDYASAGDFVHANETFAAATKLDTKHYFDRFLANRILSLEHFSGLTFSAPTMDWLEKARKGLSQI